MDTVTNDKTKRPEEFERFEALTRKLVAVPKKEIERKEKARPKRKR